VSESPTYNYKIIELLNIFGYDLTAPNDNEPDGSVTTVWNMPRDMKTDVAVVLQSSFTYFELDAPVRKLGAFEFSLLRNPDTKRERCVVTVNRTADSAERMGLGELDGVYQQMDPRLTATNADGTPLMANDGQQAFITNQASNVTVDVTVWCLNEIMADQMVLLIKSILFAAEKTFQSLGYVKPPLRTNVTDAVSIVDMDGGAKFLFERTLTYQGEHLDYIGGIDTLASLISATETLVDPLEPSDTEAQITINLGPT
jgi:hypothetical protein